MTVVVQSDGPITWEWINKTCRWHDGRRQNNNDQCDGWWKLVVGLEIGTAKAATLVGEIRLMANEYYRVEAVHLGAVDKGGVNDLESVVKCATGGRSGWINGLTVKHLQYICVIAQYQLPKNEIGMVPISEEEGLKMMLIAWYIPRNPSK